MSELVQIGSRAKQTTFCAETVDLGHGYKITIDGNGKITAGNGTYSAPRPNALSLRHVDDCPGSTPVCRASCYVHGLKSAQPDLWGLYADNSATLRRLMQASWRVQDSTAEGLGHWIRNNAAAGFRWHVSGDVFSRAYARWIVQVMRYARTPAWIYTRSLWAVALLQEAPTLAVNVSTDRDNYRDAEPVARTTGARLCYMWNGERAAYDDALHIDLPPGSVVFPDYPVRPRVSASPTESQAWSDLGVLGWRRMVCPVDAFGASEHVRCGPCKKCLRPTEVIGA